MVLSWFACTTYASPPPLTEEAQCRTKSGFRWKKREWLLGRQSTLSIVLFKKDFIYLFLERGEGRETERERHINVWLPLVCPQLGIWPATQACALTGDQTSHPLVHRPMLNPLSYTSQGLNSLISYLLKHHCKEQRLSNIIFCNVLNIIFYFKEWTSCM